MNTINLIEQELKKTYPTRIVSDLKRTNEELYLKLREYSKENNTSIKDVLESRDYIYLRKSIIRLYVDDFLELEKAFPDYKINNFYENQNKLYYRILAHAKSLKVSLKKYLNSLGFDYEAREELTSDSTRDSLLKIYPNKIVTNLSTTDNKLYYRVYQQAKKENLKLNEYLEKLGFETKNTSKETSEVEKTTKKKSTAKNNKKTKQETSSLKKNTKKDTKKNNVKVSSKNENVKVDLTVAENNEQTSNSKNKKTNTKSKSLKKETKKTNNSVKKNVENVSNDNKRKAIKKVVSKKETKSTKSK